MEAPRLAPGVLQGLAAKISAVPSAESRRASGETRATRHSLGWAGTQTCLLAKLAGDEPNFRMITLGLNYNRMHDSSACIVRDGELLFAIAEERISRIKHDAGFPRLAVQACLDFAGVTAAQLDFVCQGWPAPSRVFAADLKCF